MLLSELEAEFKAIREEHGDLPVYYSDMAVGNYYGYEVGQADIEDIEHPNYESEQLEDVISKGVLLQ